MFIKILNIDRKMKIVFMSYCRVRYGSHEYGYPYHDWMNYLFGIVHSLQVFVRASPVVLDHLHQWFLRRSFKEKRKKKIKGKKNKELVLNMVI